MSKHVAKVSRSRPKILAVVGLLTVSAATAAMTLGRADASTSDGKTAAGETTSTRTFACPGRAVQVSRTSPSSADLTCQFGVSPVGRMRADIGMNDASARTALPRWASTSGCTI